MARAAKTTLKNYFKTGITICLAATVLMSGSGWHKAYGEEKFELPDANLLSDSPFYKERHKLNKRFQYYAITYQEKPALHVFFGFTDTKYPYCFSLCWESKKTGSDTLTDEFDQTLPAPGDASKVSYIDKATPLLLESVDLLAKGQIEPCLSKLNQASQLSPKDVKVHNDIGVCYALLGQYDKADIEFGKAQELDPNYVVPVVNLAVSKINQSENGNIEPKDKEAAVEASLKFAEQAISSAATFKPAIIAKIRALTINGKKDEALSYALEQSETQVNDATISGLTGDLYAEAKNYKSAASYYEKVLALNPNDSDTALKLSGVMKNLGNMDEAMRRARTVSQNEPENAEAHIAYGKLLLLDHSYTLAQVQLERALELSLNYKQKIACQSSLLVALFALKKYELVEKFTKEWVKQGDDIAECHYNRAWALSQIPDQHYEKEIVDEYNKAIKLNAKLQQAHYNLGLYLMKLGKSKEAAKQLQVYVDEVPDDAQIEKLKALIAKLQDAAQ
jgi:Flp pilus assembly protein TadD